MSVTVEPGDPRAPGAARLLKRSHALMESLFPPEDNFYLDIDALTAPHIAFFVATEQGAVLGTAALAEMGGYGEVKSMFVDEAARGRGVGAALLGRLEAEARARALPILRLETGNLLKAAHRLYARAGFTERGPFGDYPAAPSSLFMEKRLS
ncbi:MAG: GNAT family N-acetyltransferase [Rhodobacterales bacterium]|nr:MAG: GNAT family N-acetyltransferase [Rhodobacterales bacterium]